MVTSSAVVLSAIASFTVTSLAATGVGVAIAAKSSPQATVASVSGNEPYDDNTSVSKLQFSEEQPCSVSKRDMSNSSSDRISLRNIDRAAC